MALSTTNRHLPAEAPIDLQLHTTYSDGDWTAENLLNHLAQHQFALAAITDHERPDTAVHLQQLAHEKGLPLLIAAEMTTTWRGEMTDFLCFGFDPHNNALTTLARDVWRRQQTNSRQVYAKIQRNGYSLPESPDALNAILNKPSAKQPEELVALVKHQGHDHPEMPAWKIVLEAGCTLETSAVPDVVEATHQSGGLCLLAHPGRIDGFMTFDTGLLDQLRREAPIDGLEVYHPRHTAEQTALYLDYAKRHNLLISAGSDSHSPDQPPIKYPAHLARALLERLGVEVA